MSPIVNVSNIVRMPRLGKIHLGVKVEAPGKNPYPRPTDYFVCPPEVQEVFGEKPKDLRIMFPVDDVEQFAQQWYRAYTRTQGLVCVGDGESCRRKVDLDTGAMASHSTIEGRWEWTEDLPCDPQECPDYGAKACRRVMNLQFLLPDVPGLGVWQIDTSSFYSIVNINSMIKMLKGMLGRCSMIPLTLALGPVEVTPAGLKKKTVYIMHIKKDIRLADMARLAQLPPARALIPEPEVEEPPEDLYPEGILVTPEVQQKQKNKPAKAQPAKQETSATEEKPPGEAIEGEGFTIDPTWLSESQKALKWSDETCKTFLVSKYKISPEGTLTEVLQRLTREQAENFVNEINGRREKQASLL